jgi:signal transduction histidine kinase
VRPSALDDLGLVSALSQYVAEWSRTAGVPAQFQSSGLKDIRPATDVATNLYRIAQEALNNVYKHSEAGAVSMCSSGAATVRSSSSSKTTAAVFSSRTRAQVCVMAASDCWACASVPP